MPARIDYGAELEKDPVLRELDAFGVVHLRDADGLPIIVREHRDPPRGRIIWLVAVRGRYIVGSIAAERREDLPAELTRLLPVTSKKKWPVPAGYRAPTKRTIALLKKEGFDVDARIYQVCPWWTCPVRCLRHLRRHFDGLEMIDYGDYRILCEAAQAAAPAESAQSANSTAESPTESPMESTDT